MLNSEGRTEKYGDQFEEGPLRYSYSMTRMRESHGPRVVNVEAGISLERSEFSTLRMAERGMRKRSSCSGMS